METQGCAEERSLQIVYFLSRKGSNDQPHLIRVPRLSKNGIRLRDIKKWLGELRGKEIPDSFSWSYKRKYKTGYLWQDLKDDDLIAPISDNEYVIKGSEISSINISKEFSYKDQKTSSKEENQNNSSDTSMDVSSKSPSENEDESPTFGSETSTLTDNSQNLEMCNNKVKINEQIITMASASSPRKTSLTESHDFVKSKRCNSKSGSNIFRNLMKCGGVDTNDSAVVRANKHNRGSFFSMCSSDEKNIHSVEICKRDAIRGSQSQKNSSSRKSSDGVRDSANNRSDFRDQKAPPCNAADYKPVNRPNCSQCGKQFNPEKLHTHMKSCKGMRTLPKTTPAVSTAVAVKKFERSVKPGNKSSVSGYLLTH